MARNVSVRPTLKTISEITGFAVPTVSRALHDAPDIGSETKARVREVADQIGYVPNRAGIRLRTGKTQVISLVLSTEHDMMNFTARLISSVAAALRDTPYHLIITPYFPDQDPMEPVRYIVETGSADAIIINQTEPDDPRVAYLLKRGFPFATHGRTRWCDRHAYCDFDNEAFGRIAVRRLVARRRRRLLLLAPPLHQNYAGHMVEGATGAAAMAGVTLSVCGTATSDAQRGRIMAALAGEMRQPPGFDGIVCASANSAMAAVAALEGIGLTIGRDIDLVSKEAVPFLSLFRAGIMTIHEDVQGAGMALARAAIRAIERPKDVPLQVIDVPEDEV